MNVRYCQAHQQDEPLTNFDFTSTGRMARSCMTAKDEARDRRNARRRQAPRKKHTKQYGVEFGRIPRPVVMTAGQYQRTSVKLTPEQKERRREFYEQQARMEVWGQRGCVA